MAYGDLPMDAPHKPNKGWEGGACNRQSCQAEPALFFNHGMYKWYCGDCARDIGDDVVNRTHWAAYWQPKCGHPQFETREQIDAGSITPLIIGVDHGDVDRTAIVASTMSGVRPTFVITDEYHLPRSSLLTHMLSALGPQPRRREAPRSTPARMMLGYGVQLLPARNEPEPLSKRQRRRLRGKGVRS